MKNEFAFNEGIWYNRRLVFFKNEIPRSPPLEGENFITPASESQVKIFISTKNSQLSPDIPKLLAC